MKKIKLFLIINLFLFLISCGTVREGFQNPKKNNTDEFLVEKKSPLVMPPDFDDLPSPKIGQKTIEKEDNEIKLLVVSVISVHPDKFTLVNLGKPNKS